MSARVWAVPSLCVIRKGCSEAGSLRRRLEGPGASLRKMQWKSVPGRAFGTLSNITPTPLQLPLCTSLWCPALSLVASYHPWFPTWYVVSCFHASMCCSLCLKRPLLVHLSNSYETRTKALRRQRFCTPRTQGCACCHTAGAQRTLPLLTSSDTSLYTIHL